MSALLGGFSAFGQIYDQLQQSMETLQKQAEEAQKKAQEQAESQNSDSTKYSGVFTHSGNDDRSAAGVWANYDPQQSLNLVL